MVVGALWVEVFTQIVSQELKTTTQVSNSVHIYFIETSSSHM